MQKILVTVEVSQQDFMDSAVVHMICCKYSKLYKKINASHPLVKYLPALQKIDGTASHTGIAGLLTDIPKYGSDVQFQMAQWQINLQLYWGPMISYATTNKLVLPISIGEMYDTIINFGDLNDFKTVSGATSPAKGGDEITWLGKFLDVKENIITNVDKTLDDGQPDRVILWRSIISNPQLNRPLSNLKCYGDTFNIV